MLLAAGANPAAANIVRGDERVVPRLNPAMPTPVGREVGADKWDGTSLLSRSTRGECSPGLTTMMHPR